MITAEMAHLIRHNTVAFVATVTPEGRPAVSPKATVVIIDERTLAFSNLRSPGTIRNIEANPLVELNFIDVFRRKAVRVGGEARHAARGSARFGELLADFGTWADYADRMKGIVEIAVTDARMVLSPAYDIGLDETELIAQHFERYRGLVETGELVGPGTRGRT